MTEMSREKDLTKYQENYRLLSDVISFSLKDVLSGYIGKELSTEYKKHFPSDTDQDGWWRWGVLDVLYEDKKRKLPMGGTYNQLMDLLDTQLCLILLDVHWQNIFSKKLPRSFYNWIKEANSIRNDCAHVSDIKLFDDSYTLRALDTVAQICDKIDPESVGPIRAQIRKLRYGSEEGSLSDAAQDIKINIHQRKNGEADGFLRDLQGDLPSWRQVMQPHPDVRKGQYQNAEFAADLAQVIQGRGAIEYVDPIEFFNRTYITEGMKGLLVTALKRVTQTGGEPVIELKTAFGGGKTHSMLALYHLFHGQLRDHQVENVDQLIQDAGMTNIPRNVHVAVLVGTALDPANWRRPIDMPGITIHTLWGEMAAQLVKSTGRTDVYNFVKEADKKGVSPGSDKLRQMFDACGSCVILIDELVAYARKLYGADDKKLPAGTFANILSFVQELTEAAKASASSIVVASIPESDIEIGGAAGQEVLVQIEHTFGRVESIWKPVTPNESFEVVRRRLFMPCQDEDARDKICTAFSQMYQSSGTDFPVEAKDPSYLQRMKDCYPIHPEIFDDLYEKWGTIEKFQKTRGVLRLMAGVVYQLWVNGDDSCMIMPGSVPLHITQVHDELIRYLGDNWNAIVDSEIDGSEAEAVRIDANNFRFNQFLAARRVARTIFLSTAPGMREQNVRGINQEHIFLGTVLPNEVNAIPIFNDALQKLKATLSYLYSNENGTMLWFDSRPTLRKLVADQEQRIHEDAVDFEIQRRLHKWRSCHGLGLNILPTSSSDVPDDTKVALVLLPLTAVYERRRVQNEAKKTAQEYLEQRGEAGRIHRNMLLFLAPDMQGLHRLRQMTRHFLAWQMIRDEAEERNLDQSQLREADNSIKQVEKDLQMKLSQCYCWLLAPYSDLDDIRTIQWDVYEISCTDGSNVTKAYERMKREEILIEKWAPRLLLMQLHNLLWKDKDHLSVGGLWEYLCNYCYLPRLKNEEVLYDAIRTGVSEGLFGLADTCIEGRYEGLIFAPEHGYIGSIAPQQLLVKADVAQAQENQDTAQISETGANGDYSDDRDANHANGTDGVNPVTSSDDRKDGNEGNNGNGAASAHPGPQYSHFSMTQDLDSLRATKQVNDCLQEVVNHLSDLKGSQVTIKLEVQADLPANLPKDVVRTITENCQALGIKFTLD